MEDSNSVRREKYKNDMAYRNKEKERRIKGYHLKNDSATYHHGLSKTRTWKAWKSMRDRVLLPNGHSYRLYKERTIDPRWDSFINFYEDMGECPPGLTLDRRNNNEGYNKDNCRWATHLEQTRNTSKTKLSEEKVREIKGLFGAVPSYVIAREYGVSQATICDIKYERRWAEVKANV